MNLELRAQIRDAYSYVTTMTPSPNKNIDVLCPSYSIKILKLLVQLDQLNGSEIARALRINYETASYRLRLLVNENILLEKRFGKTRLYCINEQSPKAKAILSLLQNWWS